MIKQNLFRYSLSLLILPLVLASIFTATADGLAVRDVGLWYTTIYSNEGKYVWAGGHGAGTIAQLVGNVDGQNGDDAIVVTSAGDWHVSLSDKTQLNYKGAGAWGFRPEATNRFLMNVTEGDNCADAISYVNGGSWYVRPADCQGNFGPEKLWLSGHGSGSIDQLVGFVNNDSKADAVIVTPNGQWHVAMARNDQTFNYQDGGHWKQGHGSGNFRRFLKNVNTDNKADAVIFDINTGRWYVAPNNGIYNAQQIDGTLWTVMDGQAYGHGLGSNAQLLARVDKSNSTYDAVVYSHSIPEGNGTAYGRWYVARSTNTSFGDKPFIPWISNHGLSSKLIANGYSAPSNILAGDFDADGYDDMIVFHNQKPGGTSLGEWRVMPSKHLQNFSTDPIDYYHNPDRYNYWGANFIKYMPLINGQPQQYKSKDPAIIDYHLNEIDAAGVDYVLFDLTNHVSNAWITNAAVDVCKAIDLHNQNGGSLKFAVAIGAVQYTGRYQDVEEEAEAVRKQFITQNPQCADDYYQWPDHTGQYKPLLGVYFRDKAQRDGWDSFPNKTATNDFTLKYVLGDLPFIATDDPGFNQFPNPSRIGVAAGCGTVPAPYDYPQSTYGEYIGWSTRWGAMGNGPIMIAQAGWNNQGGKTISRTQTVNNQTFDFYDNCSWHRILDDVIPNMVVINSYNEYAEETALAPTDTSTILPASQRWSNSNKYWDKTKVYIQAYKAKP